MDDRVTSISLPDDPEALKSMIVALAQERDAATQQRNQAMRDCDAVARDRDTWQIKFLRAETELLRLKKWYYGRKADQLTSPEDVAQMLLGFGEQLENRPVISNDVPAEVDLGHVEMKTVRRVKRGRRNLGADEFDQLPVTRKEHDLPDDQKPCPCCGEPRQRIGSESSWQLEYIPGHFERIEHIRFKYACKQCDQNGDGRQHRTGGQAHPADREGSWPVRDCWPSSSPVSSPIICRCTVWKSIFARNGFEIDRATHEHLVPRRGRDHPAAVRPDDPEAAGFPRDLHRRHGHADALSRNGKTKQARMWVYVGDADQSLQCV